MFDKTTKCSSGGIALSRIERSLLTIVNCVQLNQSIAKHFSENQLVPILHRGEVRFLKEPMLLEFPLTEYGIVVVGDLHGSIFDLLAVLHSIGLPPDVHYLFLGDYVGFGPHQLEVLLFILLLKLRWPEHVYMLRGKHETYEVNINDGFRTACEKAFPKTGIFSRFNALFDCMPIAAIISDRILCCHGGVSCWMICRDNIRRIPRRSFVEKMKMLDCCLLADILWADLNPKQSRPFVPSERDVSYSFNEEGLDAVLGALQVCTLVRGHYHGQNGYVELLPTKCYAIGTATDPRNKDVTGAVLGIRRDISNQYHFQAILHKRANMKDLSYYCHHMLERLEDSFISDYDAPLGSLTCSQCNFITTQELQTSARVISHIEIVDWVLKNAHKQVLHDSAYRSLDTSNMHAFAQRLIHLFPLYYDLIHLPGGTFRVAVTDTEWSVIKKYHEGLELDRNPQSTALTNALIGASARKAETVDMTGVEKDTKVSMNGKKRNKAETRTYVSDENRNKVLDRVKKLSDRIRLLSPATNQTNETNSASSDESFSEESGNNAS